MKLNDYKHCFNLSYDQFISQHNIHGSQIQENRRYEKMTNLILVEMSDDQFFFFKDSKLKMIYISNDVVAKQLWAEFKNTTEANTPGKIVRSRAGKTANQIIFAGSGITASIAGNDVAFIELYPTCSLQDYLENIYSEVQPFIR
ncbi:MAG TPA: hypothetical protein VD884_15885 [Ohtaekwangia sp.]|nr:hypothetical protein [Ohtaekwangia sp.]